MASDLPVQLIGRSSSHFTRAAAIFAHELGVPFELVVVHDLTSLDAATFGGHPALKIPTLRTAGGDVYGTENICRALTERAGAGGRVAWPEATGAIARNAQELTWHAMAAQVQLVVGTLIGKLPAENVFFAKISAGFRGALAWLDANLDRALDELPAARALSLLEVTLFCLVEHLTFRGTLDVAPYPRLRRLAADFGSRPAAQLTAYRYDPPPGA